MISRKSILIWLSKSDFQPLMEIWLSKLEIPIRAPQDVDVLAVLDLWVPRSRPWSHCGRPSFLPCAWWENIWDKNQESQDGNKEFENPGRQGRRLRRPGTHTVSIQYWYGTHTVWIFVQYWKKHKIWFRLYQWRFKAFLNLNLTSAWPLMVTSV